MDALSERDYSENAGRLRDALIQDAAGLAEEMAADARRFVTKDSGKRAQYSTGMVRDTRDGKARFDLIFPKLLPYKEQLITRFAELMARGAEKYDERNWEQARTEEELERYKDSAMRHLTQWLTGETDEDHAAAVIFNLMGAEYVKYRLAQEAKVETANSMLEHGGMVRAGGLPFPSHVAGTKPGICPLCDEAHA